ncbi:Uncharacterized protein HZ326_25099 [Fusarium oxysporum f. sp. albedinis]|nr:Uncharacterized protein HZ326_25099 [Fusarium oxysporum f. sp. albedinis]
MKPSLCILLRETMSDQIASDILGDFQQPVNSKSSQAPTGRFVCDCGKSYMRKEHLKRHQATHDSQPHKCHVCGQSYTRK